MGAERRYSGSELRAEGRRLIGPAIRYGDISPSHKERFEPGAFALDGGTRWLNVRHDATRVIAWTGGGGLELEDGAAALEVSATLPAIPLADKALAEVRAGTLAGFSIEFSAIRERMDGAIRVIEAATLAGIGLVQSPSYEGSTVEARARRGRVRSSIPYDVKLRCRCHRNAGECDQVQFSRGSFAELIAADNVILFSKDYAGPLASTRKGTLRLRETDKGLAVDADIPDTSAGNDLVEAARAVPFLVRPLFDPSDSMFTEAANVATYSRVSVRALLIGATDAAEGWPEAMIAAAKKRTASRGRVWL